MSDKKIIKGKSGVAFFEYTSWCHRYKEIDSNGNIKYGKKKGFKTEEEAVESYKKYKEKYDENFNKIHITVSKDITVKDYLKYWFENIYSERIEGITKVVGIYILDYLIMPNIEYDIKISLTTTDYLDEILEKASKYTKYSGYVARGLIMLAFKDAFKGGYINYNVSLKTKIYMREKPKIRIFSKEQLKRFLILAKKTKYFLEILLGLFCGLRKGEIYGLKFQDFNLETDVLSINRQIKVIYQFEGKKVVGRELVEGPPKTPESVRKIKFPSIIKEELIKRKKLIEKNKLIYEYYDNDYICCQNNGLAHYPVYLNKALDKICNELSLPHISVHSLRHMCATILLESGVTLSKIAAFLGHTSIHTTFEYYCEVMDEKDEILSFINTNFNEETI